MGNGITDIVSRSGLVDILVLEHPLFVHVNSPSLLNQILKSIHSQHLVQG